jgi:hypothetical protein
MAGLAQSKHRPEASEPVAGVPTCRRRRQRRHAQLWAGTVPNVLIGSACGLSLQATHRSPGSAPPSPPSPHPAMSPRSRAAGTARQRRRAVLRPPGAADIAAPQRIDGLGHVWTAPGWQEFSSRKQQWSEQPCVRPVSAVHVTAYSGSIPDVPQILSSSTTPRESTLSPQARRNSPLDAPPYTALLETRSNCGVLRSQREGLWTSSNAGGVHKPTSQGLCP